MVLTGHDGGVSAVAVSPDSRWLATGDSRGTVRIWDSVNGQRQADFLTGHVDGVSALRLARRPPARPGFRWQGKYGSTAPVAWAVLAPPPCPAGSPMRLTDWPATAPDDRSRVGTVPRNSTVWAGSRAAVSGAVRHHGGGRQPGITTARCGFGLCRGSRRCLHGWQRGGFPVWDCG